MDNASKQGQGGSAGKVIGGGVWTMIERIISQASQLVIFVAAARLLTPAEFGTFALVSACAILLLRVAEVGWAQYIMSWKGDPTVPQQVLFVSILSGALIGLAGAGSSLLLPFFGVGPGVAELVALFSLWVFLATASSAQKGVMIWQDKLRSSAWAEIAGEAAGLGTALAALFTGWGVFSLVFGRLAFQTVHLIVSFAVTRLKPRPGLRGQGLRDLMVFSGQVFSSRMIINLRLYVATFIIGGFLGPTAVGYYRAAERLVGSIAEVVGVPAQIMAWSLFRQARDATPEGEPPTAGFQKQANLYFRFMMAIALPVFIWLGVMGGDLIAGLLGEEWLPALPVVAILAAARVIMMPGTATEPLLSLAGEIKRLPPFTLVFFVLTVGMTLVAAPFGLFAIAWAQVAVGIVIFFATVWLLRRHAGVDLVTVYLRSARLIVPLGLGVAVLVLLRESPLLQDWPPLARALAAPIPALLVYAGALAALDPRLRQLAAQALTRRIGS